MPPKTSVKGSESLTEETPESLSEQGDEASLKSDERGAENLRRENERKAQEIAELRSQLTELKTEKEERIEELENKSKLTASEAAEMQSLEAQIAAIKGDQRSLAWRELQKRESHEVIRKEIDTLDFENALDMVEELAEKEGMETEKFEREIKPFLRAYSGERPTRKVKKAYRDLIEKRKLLKEVEELKKGQDGSVRRENNETPPRPQGKKEIFDNAKKTGSFAEMLRAIEAGQSAARSR